MHNYVTEINTYAIVPLMIVHSFNGTHADHNLYVMYSASLLRATDREKRLYENPSLL